MTKDLQEKLKQGWHDFTESEQRIAAYLLDNMSGIPFETAASVGQHVGVSAMTVGRFLRKLGYAGVAEIKEELRGDTTWLKLYRTSSTASAESDSANLKAEIRVLSKVHALAKSGQWQPIVRLLACSDQVSIAGFQLGRFLGQTFATLLQHIRPRVSFATGVDGAYTDVLIDSTGKSCVVLIDERRYSRHFRILAKEVAARAIPLVIITDNQCYWARRLTPHVLMVPVRDDRAWHDFGAYGSLFSLLCGAVIRERGDAVYERVARITELRQQFIGFDGPSMESGEANAASTHAAEAKVDRRARSRRKRR